MLLNLISSVPYTHQYAIKDLRQIASAEDLASYNIDSIETELNDFLILYEDDEKYATHIEMCEGEGTEKIYSIHKTNMNNFLIFIKFFNELKNESNNKLFSNYQLINDYFRMSTSYIFIAFLFQFVIFIIIQFFELRASSSEEEK